MKNKTTRKNWMISASCLALGVLGCACLYSAALGAPVKGLQRTGTITPWKAMELAEKKTGGRAIEAVFEFDDGHWGYSVYVAAKGKLWEVELNKDTGKFGDVEEASPSGEAKELEGDLNRALKG